MGSLISGYNYDIFISYRQKDNKHDGWVTKFVENLKGELEATFKEDISIYFDENPHDRLQETHDVDKSLEGKLKCLIFIPILSQTYCDPNSYAWQYEFLPFNKFIDEDHFGKNIRLRNGNFASRILPIKIHDLEQEDIMLFEKETGSVLRAMDFVYKTSSGVNRPLQSNEDRPNDNLNKTLYRDQINKVANSIKEIIQGLKAESVVVEKERTTSKEPVVNTGKVIDPVSQSEPIKSRRVKLLSGLFTMALLIIVIVTVFPELFRRDTLDKLRSSDERISIAVMPFQNMTNDTVWNVWQDGLQDILITSLSENHEELSIKQTESIVSLIQGTGITSYASITPTIASSLSKKLDANIVICGTLKKAGNTLRINARLISTETEEVFKSFEISGTAKEENIFPIADSLKTLIKNYLLISRMEREASPDFRKVANTSSPEAYRYFIYGEKARRNRDFKTQVNMFSNAIAADSNFYFAYIYLAFAYTNYGFLEDAKKICLDVYKRRDMMTLRQKLWTDRLYSSIFETPNEEISYLRQLLKIDDQSPFIYYSIGLSYNALLQYDRAIPEFEKALEIYKKWGTKPYWIGNYSQLGIAYHETGQYEKEEQIYITAEQDFPDILIIKLSHNSLKALLCLKDGKNKEATRYIENIRSLLKEESVSEAAILLTIAGIYTEADLVSEAEDYYRKALSLDPKEPSIMNNLAYLFYKKNIRINEGMLLIDKAIQLSPDNYIFLATKGELLYAQGKYKEALELFQKSWELKPRYNHEIYLDLQSAKKAVDSLKNN